MKQRAFTIVELLIVVVIIGVLASVAVPSFTAARNRTITKEGLAIMSILINGVKMKNIETGDGVTCSDRADCVSVLGISIPNSVSWTISNVMGVSATLTANQGLILKWVGVRGVNYITCSQPEKCGCAKWDTNNMTCIEH